MSDAALTEREEQILFALADGLENTEIAGELHLSAQTIKHYLRSLFEKLGARNRAHAVALAYHRGLLIPRKTGAVETTDTLAA